MSKKKLGGFDSLLGGSAATATAEPGNGKAKTGDRGRPRTNFTPDLLPEDEDRASIIVKTETWTRFKALCYWERRKQKSLLDDCLTSYLNGWEKKHGTAIKALPPNAEV